MSKPTTVFMARIALENLNGQLLGVEAILRCLSSDAMSDIPVTRKHLAALADLLENAVYDARSRVAAVDKMLTKEFAESGGEGASDGP